MTQAVDTASAAPQTAADETAGVRRRRRPRWRVVVASLAVLVVAALAASGIWLSHYQPLGGGGGAFGIGTTSATEVRTIDNVYGTDFRIIAPKPGENFVIMFGIINSGPLAVTIDRIAHPFNLAGTVGDPSHQDTTTAGVTSLATDPALADFHDLPVTLAPGQAAQVRINFSILDCATVPGYDGSSTGMRSLLVVYRALGFTHTAMVNVGAAYSAEALPHCP